MRRKVRLLAPGLRSALAVWVFLLAALLRAAPALADDPAYAPGGTQLCLACHGPAGMLPAAGILQSPHARESNPASPFSTHGCETCHGPSAQHLQRDKSGKQMRPTVTFDKNTPVEKQNAICLDCHQDGQRVHWQSSAHEVEGVACASCHTLHTAHDPLLDKQGQVNVCFNCHKDKRAQLHKSSSHPIVEGLMTCSDCHNPHGSGNERLLVKGAVNETCYQCHSEKRGPFLWEHAPVREDCTNCHEPHGSMHSSLLKSPQPWLCQQCHQAAFHPSTQYSGADIPPAGAAQQMLSRACLNCHTQVHGSNHPSGVRLTR